MAKYSREIYEQARKGKWTVARIASTCGISKQAVCQMNKKYSQDKPVENCKEIDHTVTVSE